MSADDEAIERLLRSASPDEAGELLDLVSDRSIARVMRQLDRNAMVQIFDQLTLGRGDEVFRLLQGAARVELLTGLSTPRASALFAVLDPDDRAWILHDVPRGLSAPWIEALEPSAREVTQRLSGYGPRSTGQVMNPHVLDVSVGMSVGETLDLVRSQGGHTETVYMLPVLDQSRTVLGVVSLRRLVVSDPQTRVEDVMASPAVTMRIDQDQEESARVFREARLIAAPVVDDAGRLAGVLTVDDVMRILAEADAEDAARGTGSERLRRSYLATSIRDLVRSRVGWLLVLIFAATLTVNVLDHFEETLSEVVVLALFVPLLIGTGGNVGAQTATTVVRSMAVGDIQPADFGRVLVREVGTGGVLGVVLAAVGFVPAALFADRSVAIVVCLSLVMICVLATMVGSITPMLARQLGIDPAVVSAPFISTVVDATGLIVYFLMARAVLGVS